MKAAVTRAWRRLRRHPSYEPTSYWEGRAADLIDTYDHPERWVERGWTQAGIEERRVPELLLAAHVRSVFVVGAGSGRQYGFLQGRRLELRGIDISPTLVDVCNERYPDIPTRVDDLIGAEHRHCPADAVLSSAVMQHVPPGDIADGIAALVGLSRRLIILRELSFVAVPSFHVWVHDYDTLLADWRLIADEITDDDDRFQVRLAAWERR